LGSSKHSFQEVSCTIVGHFQRTSLPFVIRGWTLFLLYFHIGIAIAGGGEEEMNGRDEDEVC
jgi:hypothetical protein